LTVRNISLSDVTFDAQEEHAVVEVLRSGWISSGQITEAFESELAAAVGVPHAVATTNCTAALHVALLALGIGAGDEVLVPSLTFVATVNAVRYTGATPVFVDVVSMEDWTIAPAALRNRITGRSRAIVPMHYAGFPCDMDSIGEIARDHGLSIIEDAAHGPGSWIGDRHIGTIGDVGCFSFFANKNLTTGEGGMLVTANAEIAARARHLRSHGMTTMSWERHRGHAYQYDVVALGYNFRFDELRAAIGRVQLRKLEGNNARRAAAYDRYAELLARVPGVQMPFSQRHGRLSHHLCPVLLDEKLDRLDLMKRLRARGVQTSVHYPPAHLMSIHRDLITAPLPLTEAIGRRELTLPLHPGLGMDDVNYVVEALRECL
jgi:dTDP-4-amino-4,6-dideoxygalactose transaminase